MRIVFFGSGAFGLPTFDALAAAHDIRLVVTQPDRPAGRKRVLTPTPIGARAADADLQVIKPENVNDPSVVEAIHAENPDAFVVIAYGQKLGGPLLKDRFAINLHSSLLPKYRGAAPINWAVLNADEETGVSVITLAARMDAGSILGQTRTPLDPMETAGELHDRLAELGPALVGKVLSDFEADTLTPIVQDESAVTQARKLSKADGVVDFAASARAVQARVHGMTPWPGCTVTMEGEALKVLRVEVSSASASGAPGTLLDENGTVACGDGAVRILEIQPPGKRAMTWTDYARGRAVRVGVVMS